MLPSPTRTSVFFSLVLLLAGCRGSGAPAVLAGYESTSAAEAGVTSGAWAALGAWRLEVYAGSLEAEARYLPERVGSAQGDAFLLPLNRFITASTFELRNVGRIEDELRITYRVTHPFAAPNDPSGVASATNRADLGFAGVLLFLADVESPEGQTFFEDVVANTELVANADAYWQPGGMLARTASMTANCFPGLDVVDESGTGNRVGISNGGNPTGNFGTNGWTRSELGEAPFTGWTGYGVLHQGQSADRTVTFDLDKIEGDGALSLDVALIAKYTDPRGGETPAEKQTNRLPSKPADFRKFAYRMPHGALDVSQCMVGQPSGPLTSGVSDEVTMQCSVLDWDSEATVSSSSVLADEPDLTRILASAPGTPVLHLSIPGLTSEPVTALPLASGPLRHDYRFTIVQADTQYLDPGRYAGMIRMTDPEAAYMPAPTKPLDIALQPLTQDLPVPVTYQACGIEMQSGSWAAEFHLTPGFPSDLYPNATPEHLLVDHAGSTYVQGYFRGTVNFAPELPGGTIASFDEDVDTFVLSLAPDGTPQWVVRWPYHQLGRAMALSTDDSLLFCVSDIADACDLDPGSGSDIRVPHTGVGATAAIAALSTTDGSYAWGHAWVASARSQLYDVAVSGHSGDLLLPLNPAGGAIDLDPGAGTVTVNPDSERLLLLALSQQGAFRWFTQLQPVEDGSCRGTALAIAPTGDVIVTGSLTRSVDFNPGPGLEIRSAAGSSTWPIDDFVLKLDPAGRFGWVSILVSPQNFASVHKLIVTPSGISLMQGTFRGTLDCDPSEAVFELQSQRPEAADPFFLGLTAEGALQWAGQAGRFTYPGEFVCDAQKRLWVPIVWSSGFDDLDPTTGVWTQDAFGQANSVLLTLDEETGVILEHRRVQSSGPGFARLGALSVAPSNQSIRWGGSFGDNFLDVDPGPAERLITPPNDGTHGLVLRLNPDGSW